VEPVQDIRIQPADHADLTDILRLQKQAFQEQVQIYDHPAMPPMRETEEEMARDLERGAFLKAVVPEGRIVGTVRSRLEDGTCHVARLAVHPDWQNRGLGTRLLEAAEAQFPEAGRYELYTGHRSEKNLYLYRKHGYREFRRESVNETTDLVFLEKPGPARHG
jgi:ribosomal protein S18 acetylase RimI-like enzyme